jgi:hypothetical protein
MAVPPMVRTPTCFLRPGFHSHILALRSCCSLGQRVIGVLSLYSWILVRARRCLAQLVAAGACLPAPDGQKNDLDDFRWNIGDQRACTVLAYTED